MKIRTRLTLYFTLLVMTLITLRSSITYFSTYTFTKQSFYKRLEEKAHTTADLLLQDNNIDSAMLKTIERSLYDMLDHEKISVYNASGAEIYTTNDTLLFAVTPAIVQEIKKKTKLRYSEGEYRVAGLLYQPSPGSEGFVIVSSAIDTEGNQLLSQVRITLFSTLMASVIINLILGWFFVGKVLEPMSSIIRKVSTLSPVERSERLPEFSEKDEISELVKTFNQLFDKLEQSFRLQKGFVANASHELFNPLATIKSQLEVSLMQHRDSESYRHTVQSVLDDVNELIDMTHHLLNLSKLRSDYTMDTEYIRVDELLFEIRDDILSASPAYSVNISIENPPENENLLLINGNHGLLKIAVKNIIENACKFSYDKTARVNLQIADRKLLLAVVDTGPGISAQDIKFIFQPFYRSPTAREKKGYGIGLALAHEILTAHGCQIDVKSEMNKGTTFCIGFLDKKQVRVA